MKIRRTIKKEYLGMELKHAGFTEIVDERYMKRTITNTTLGALDTKEVDPDSQAIPKANRPWGSVVGMRILRETGRIETFASVFELIEA